MKNQLNEFGSPAAGSTLRTLELRLKEHDAYFDYSDDHNAWHRGNEQLKEINLLVKMLGKQGVIMYEQYLGKFKG